MPRAEAWPSGRVVLELVPLQEREAAAVTVREVAQLYVRRTVARRRPTSGSRQANVERIRWWSMGEGGSRRKEEGLSPGPYPVFAKKVSYLKEEESGSVPYLAT